MNEAVMAYGNKITEPAKQVLPMFFIKSHFVFFKKKKAAAICILHFAPAMPVDNNFCCILLYSGQTSTNHQVIIADSTK